MKKIILLLLLAFPGAVYAGDGNDLKESCLQAERLWSGKAGNVSDGNYCFGLVKGIVTTMTIMANSMDAENARKFGVCKGDQSGTFITMDQALASVLKFIYANPERLKEQDFAIVIEALQKSYPCK